SLLGDTGAALSLCAAGATAIAATVSVRRQWAPLRSGLLRLGLPRQLLRRLRQLRLRRRVPPVLSGATYDPAACGYSRHAALTGARKRQRGKGRRYHLHHDLAAALRE